MLSRKYSLSTTEINQILRKKNFLNFPPFFCYYAFSDADFSQVAVTVSKKIKTKPKKNKIKRQAKHLIKPLLSQITPKKIVFIAKVKWTTFAFQEIKAFMQKCFLKLEERKRTKNKNLIE